MRLACSLRTDSLRNGSLTLPTDTALMLQTATILNSSSGFSRDVLVILTVRREVCDFGLISLKRYHTLE